MDVNGSPEFALTWKTWDMPAGEPICALRASERRTGGKGCIGWPTPQANKNTKNSRDPKRMKENGSQTCLADAAHLAGWPTARANDGTGDQECIGRMGGPSLKQVAGWATPRAEDAESAGMRHSRGVADTLSAQAGQDVSRSNAGTERSAGFRLNPRFSLWLMGYPVAWASCGERVMQSFQKQRRRL
jgi:hypothetical protein